MGGMTAAHALSMNPVVAKKAMTVWQDAYPARPKALHFITMPPVIESVFKMMEGFQKEKMKKRNHVHPKGDMSKMQEDLGLDILPKEYGGTNGTVEELTSFWLDEMEKNRDWLMERNEITRLDRSKENRRKPKTYITDYLVIGGSLTETLVN
eukprot:TRINITY_DN20822_c0_g1_i1.p1 TRINITY_DN20822_c0_g1~~TRINITY_DN20822_c0_g1_i1.p1  ORF type:complete len:163 (+),score=38.21 TRINITY_DN20822_c0_g1_i1:34-489(+)